MMSSAMVGGGLLLLFFAADFMIRGAVATARRLNISPHVIGLTVIAFGTSAPELLVSVKAAMNGSPGIAIGNVVGSNIANILLMIGTVGILAPFLCKGASLRRDAMALAAATILFVALMMSGHLERPHGIIMVVSLVAFFVYSYWDDRRRGSGEDSLAAKEVEEIDNVPSDLWRSVLYTILGLIGVMIGAELLVEGAIAIAISAGISETVIGITLVAIGTSMPELATTLVAAIRRHSDVALGNIIGSNIFNTLGILGVVAIVQPIPVPPEILSIDLWIMVFVTGVFVAGAVYLKSFGRGIAIVFFIAYCLFISEQFVAFETLSVAVAG